MGVCCALHETPLYSQNLALKFADQLRSSVGILRLRTKSHGVYIYSYNYDVVVTLVISFCDMSNEVNNKNFSIANID
jgi:hypothetical protein